MVVDEDEELLLVSCEDSSNTISVSVRQVAPSLLAGKQPSMNDDHALRSVSHAHVNIRTIYIRLIKESSCDFDIIVASTDIEEEVCWEEDKESGGGRERVSDVDEILLRLCEAERAGSGEIRNDLVDQVLTRFNGSSGGCSDDGVDGGVFGEASTSNCRERYAREFILCTQVPT
jgi:hypothetical protein